MTQKDPTTTHYYWIVRFLELSGIWGLIFALYSVDHVHTGNGFVSFLVFISALAGGIAIGSWAKKQREELGDDGDSRQQAKGFLVVLLSLAIGIGLIVGGLWLVFKIHGK